MSEVCFTCGIELHQPLNGRIGDPFAKLERSYSTCFESERICQVCEDTFKRRKLPKRSVGTLSAAPKYREPKTPNDLKLAVKLRKPYAEGNVSYTPATIRQ